jgi:LPS-assembly lipoprotein
MIILSYFKSMRWVNLLMLTLLLSACGFHLRGHHQQDVKLAFQSVYIKSASETSFVADLRNALIFNKVTVSERPETGVLTLEIISESTDKQILAMSSAGKIREFQLQYRVKLRAYDVQLLNWLPEEEIVLVRTLTFDDAQVLAKEQEEALLYKDMRADAVMQALRRLSRAKPPKVEIAPVQ